MSINTAGPVRFAVGCRLRYRVEAANTFVFNLAVADSACQRIEGEDLRVEPELAVEEARLLEGSRHMRLHAPAGELTVEYRAGGTLDPLCADPGGLMEVPPAELPLGVVHYIYPSRYCPSDRLLRFAAREFGGVEPGYARVQTICAWIRAHIEYASGASTAHTGADETLIGRRGVCRDFAHLGIALCRALNIPARFVAGYALGLKPPDFHACFEAYLSGRWWLFDPTGLTPRASVVRVGTGRDAADASFATIFGRAQMEAMEVFYEGDGEETARHEDRALSTC